MTGQDFVLLALAWGFASIPASILMGALIGAGAGPQAVRVRRACSARQGVRLVDIAARINRTAE